MDREQQAGELKVIPFNPKSPHPDLIPDEDGIQLLRERNADHDTCWTLRKPTPVSGPAMEYLTRKALINSYNRTCPVHGEVKVLSKSWRPKGMTCIDSLSCGHSLLIYRVAGFFRAGIDRTRAISREHRGWLFTFKDTVKANR